MKFKKSHSKKIGIAIIAGFFLLFGVVKVVKTVNYKSASKIGRNFEPGIMEAGTDKREESVEPPEIEATNGLRQIHSDSEILGLLLEDNDLLARMNAWNGKGLFVKFDPTKTPPEFSYYYHNSVYQDENQNNIQDPSDQGFFNPASTVKVGLAALVLEELNKIGFNRQAKYRIAGSQKWYSFDEDIRRALVISDNDATNRLILWLGFDLINHSFKNKGLRHFVINRLMLDRGTLVPSPPFEMRLGEEVVQQSKKRVTVELACYETSEKIGNCATATDLVEGLIRINQPEYFNDDESFELTQEDREWLREVMSHTPRQEGFEYEDDYCRFLTNLKQKVADDSGKMLSKCGVSLFTTTYTDLSYLETDTGQRYYILLSVSPPRGYPEEETIRWMSKVAETILSKLP